eukprot:403277_1
MANPLSKSKYMYIAIIVLCFWTIMIYTPSQQFIYHAFECFFLHIKLELIIFIININGTAVCLRKMFGGHNSLYLIYLSISFTLVWILFLQCKPYQLDSNKFTVLQQIPAKYRPFMFPLNDSIHVSASDHYPMVFKPTDCTSMGRGVRIIRSPQEAFQIHTLGFLQQYIPYRNEVGILFEKHLTQSGGRIVSMVEKHFPQNVFTGVCFKNNVTCTDISFQVTDTLQDIFNEIANAIPNFYVGRFDVRFQDIESLMNGKHFYILELNGTMGFDLRKFPHSPLLTLWRVQRWYWYRIVMGIRNTVTLRGFNILILPKAMKHTLEYAYHCSDWDIFSI